jgi:hypothetical protein
MIVFKKSLILWLCVSFFFFQFPYISSTAEAGVTAKKPEMISSPEEDIPVVEGAEPSKKGHVKLLWALLGVALIGGVAAVALGGGGGGGEDDTGSFEATW